MNQVRADVLDVLDGLDVGVQYVMYLTLREHLLICTTLCSLAAPITHPTPEPMKLFAIQYV